MLSPSSLPISSGEGRPPADLIVSAVSVLYSRTVRAVDELSFSVGKGEIVALLGPNGAGKSTTLRALTGFLPGDRAQVVGGSIRFQGQELGSLPPHRTSRAGISLTAERDKIFATLTVEENMRIGGRANPRRADTAALTGFVFDLFPILRERYKQRAGYLSGGERQMLAIATALLSGPKLLLVDELSLGLAPRIVSELSKVLLEVNRERKMTILLVEQSAAVAFSIAQYVYVLNLGRVTAEGRPSDLRSRQDFSHSYMGTGRAHGDTGTP